MDLRAHAAAEYARRRQANRRYSLRAYARSLGVHHATLHRLFRTRRRVTDRTIRRLGARLGLTQAEIAHAAAHEHAGLVLELVRHPRFRASSRWLAVRTGLSIDHVNVALQSLLHSGRLAMRSRQAWNQEGS